MSLLEVLSAVFGLVAVYFTANKSVWGWPFGIINVFLFGLLYYRNCLFANMWLQLMFLALSIYGWIVWVRSGTSQGKVETIRSSSRKELFFFALLAAALLPAIYFLLSNYTSGLSRQQIFLDALTTSMSIVAQYMMARKILQCWFFWIFTDSLYITMNISMSMYLMCILYVLFIILSLSGYRAWKKTAESSSQSSL